MPIRRPLSWVLGGVSILGVFAAVAGVWAAVHPAAYSYYPVLITLATTFAIMSPWSVRLPSGAAWRPSMALVTTAMFLLPRMLAPLVALPGLILVTALSRSPWRAYALTIGHVAAALYAGTTVYQLFAPDGRIHLPEMLPPALAGLAVHFVVNRLLSATIVAVREKRRFGQQLRLVAGELNWGHLNLYLMSIIIAVMYREEGPWGLFLAMALLAGIYQSVSYYTNLHELQQAASRDGLTGAENRTAWEGFMQAMCGRQRIHGTLFMIDLDNFKAVNDSLGHQEGDRLLREAAQVLKRNLRKSDRLFRYGGDEFVIFTSHGPGAESAVKERVLRVIDNLDSDWKGTGVPARLSVGFATWPAEATAFSELLSLADERMYSAKSMHKLQSTSQ